MAGKYPKPEYVAHTTTTVLQHKRASDKVIEHPREQPGNIIIIHGVNDVGTSYADVEAGLCAGLERRLYRHFKPADYTLPTDKDQVVDDPDDVYYKRKLGEDTNSPVIPFYWGYREIGKRTKTVNGQKTDRYGNRLDKDLSKEGGPFGNATSTLPDMWNCGVGAPADVMNDPLRPLRSGPGRMYMVLAARRLAALVAMIRDYEPKDTVTIVAHSQGCLIGLLAQAFLMERGERTADTLILTHPPYGLDEDINWKVKAINVFSGGSDDAMALYYDRISGTQTMNARLQTLVNIVQGVAKAKADQPTFAKIDEASCGGMVEGRWKPDGDRDNRGKVYLYFSPEDMTVALDNMKGIGWQGVPDYIRGTRWTGKDDGSRWRSETIMRRPLAELGTGFRQRVFTAKQRLDPRTQKVGPVLVGLPPHDFALRLKGEDDHAHVESSGRDLRASLPVARWPVRPGDTPEEQRTGIRAINGEPLANPCQADMRGSQVDADKLPAGSSHAMLKPADRGPCEEVDPITAAIAITSNAGMKGLVEERPDPAGHVTHPAAPQLLGQADLQRMETAYNAEKNPKNTNPDDRFTVLSATRHPNGKVLAVIGESPNAARRRWQHELGAKSFHSAIFDSARNHSQVTAYDVAIGSGKAASDPKFYAYMCAVADWRLKKPGANEKTRPNILRWENFVANFGAYLQCEPSWRRELIEGNANYYSTGNLPACLPLLTGHLWEIVVSETVTGTRVGQPVDVEETS